MEKISLQSLEKRLFSLKEEWKFYFQFPFQKKSWKCDELTGLQ